LISFLLVMSGVAWGQDVIREEYPIDVERFKPFMDTYGYGLTESSATLHNLQVGLGMWGNYSQDPVVLLWNGSRVIGPAPDFPDGLIDDRSVVNFQLGMGLADVFSLTVDLPVVAWQEGFEPTAEESIDSQAELVSAGLGDMRIAPKFVVADIHEGYPVGLAIITRLGIPTGDTRSFIGDGGVSFTPMVALEAADGSIHDRDYVFRSAINAGAIIKSPDTFRDLEFGTGFLYRGAMAVRPAPALELGADLAGEVYGTRIAHVPVEILPWLRVFPVEWVHVTAGVGFGLNPGLGAPDFRAWGGGTIAPSFDPLSLDRDGDGIPNKFDQCINIPEDLDGWQDEDGCPEDDNDLDGILDTADACPNDPEDPDGFEDTDGCPDPDNDRDGVMDVNDACPLDPEDFDDFEDLDGCPDLDNDRDGIPDLSDACPNAAETFNGFEDADGCPDERPHVDTDGDGLTDDVDGCPFDPEDFDSFEDADGCPDADNDQDGIFDIEDQCPFDPETLNGYLDEDGCPDEKPSRVSVTKTKIVITDKVYFETAKAKIQPLSFELLEEVALVINDHAHIQKIRVEGHTDSDGGEAYNQKLSQARADSVREFLVNAGVEPGRLEAVGYGESEPIDTNRTAEGKANNRRVEFTILEQEE